MWVSVSWPCLTNSIKGSTGPPASIITAWPVGSSATMSLCVRKPSLIERSTIMWPTLPGRACPMDRLDVSVRSTGGSLSRMSLIHTCYRITDIDRSVAFYEALGFREVRRAPIRDEAINVFMNLPEDGEEPRLELTYNIGRTEPYDIGTGYGHIAITTENLDGTLAELSKQGIEPERPPYTVSEGGSRICFVRDPDDYRIEIIERAAR